MLCPGLTAASGRAEAPGSPDSLLMLLPLGCAEHVQIRLFFFFALFGSSAWHIVGSPQMVVEWDYAM